MGGSSGPTQTREETKDPWGPAKPVLRDVLTNARMYGNDPTRFQQTFGQDTRDAATGIANLGRNPMEQQTALRGLIDGTQQSYGVGQDALRATASGGMLTSNPYLDSVLANSRRRAADSVNQQFAGAGRYGSGAHTGILGDRLGAIETDARMKNYNAERSNQLNAAGILNANGQNIGQYAGQMDAANLQQQQLLAQGGAMQDVFTNAERTAPLAATQWMAGLGTPIAGLGGTGTQTQTSTTSPDKLGMVIGGLTAAAGVATGNPMMAMNGVSKAAGSYSGGGGGGAPMGGSMFGGGGGSGSPFFGAFGTPGQGVQTQLNAGNYGNVGQSTVGADGLPQLGGSTGGIFGNWY